jgi:diguanylate cyclase (GGDEF)-like protein
MLPAPIPKNERERLASLREMNLLSTPDEEVFDRITRVAQRVFNLPIVLISLIDSDRQWFKSCIGLPVRETGRDVSFCGHAIMSEELLVVENALEDDRFFDNPLVTGEPRVIFYAGRPLMNKQGFLIGTLCVIGHEARHFTSQERLLLNDLGNWLELVFNARGLSDVQKEIFSEQAEYTRNERLDAMLNIWQRETIVDVLAREVTRSADSQSAISAMRISIENWQNIRNTNGKAAADSVLIEFVKRMRTIFRSHDSIGRLEHGEFLGVLPVSDISRAKSIAKQIVKAMAAPFGEGDDSVEVLPRIGLSFANFVDDQPSPFELLRRADMALTTAAMQESERVEVYFAS